MNAILTYGEAIARNFGNGPLAEAVEEGIFRLLDDASTAGGAINEITPKGDGMTAEYNVVADAHVVDNGYGPLEYWGSRFVHHANEPELCDESDVEVEIDSGILAAAGIRVDQYLEGDVMFDGSGEDVYAVCNHAFTVTVTNEEMFREWAETWLESAEGRQELARCRRCEKGAA